MNESNLASMLLPTFGLAISFYGWGQVTRKVLRSSFPRTCLPILGVFAMIIMGGPLVLMGIAHAATVSLLLLAGIAAAGISIFQDYRKSHAGHPRGFKARLATLAKKGYPYSGVILTFMVSYPMQALPTAFNMHDDFEKYFKYPVRLLQTGSLDTGPFDSLGVTALGGTSFLQVFPALLGPLPFINIMDSVLALTFCMLMLVAVMKQQGHPGYRCIYVSLLIPLIDPLYVNISANYLGSSLYIFLFLLPFFAGGIEDNFRWKLSVLYGLGYAGLVILKTNLALTVPVHFSVLAGFALLMSPHRARILKTLWRIPGISLLLALPWFLVHREKYFGIFNSPDHGLGLSDFPRFDLPDWDPLQTEALLYGFSVTHLHYTLLPLVFLVFSIACFLVYRRGNPKRLWQALVISVTCMLCYLICMTYLSRQLSGYTAVLRYVSPVLIGGLAIFAIPLYRNLSGGDKSRHWVDRLAWATPLSALLLVFFFLPSLWGRFQQAREMGSTRCMPIIEVPDYTSYSSATVGNSGLLWMRMAQEHIPKGETVLAWTLASFQLSYNRNTILDVEPAGLSSPWVHFPYRGSLDERIDFLQDLGVDYIMWQHKGAGIRSKHGMQLPNYPIRVKHYQHILHFMDFLERAIFEEKILEIVYSDENLVIARLPETQ